MKTPCRFAFVCALIVLAVASASANTIVTLNWAAATDNGFGTSNGTPLPVGNEIRVGTFDFAPPTYTSSVQTFMATGDVAGLASHFTTFDIAFIGTSAFPNSLGMIPLNQRAGLFEDSSGEITVPTGSPQFDRAIFVWVFLTIDNAPVAADYSNVMQIGIYGSTTPAWQFPSDTGFPTTTSLEITNLSNSTGNALAGTEQILYGSFGPSTMTLSTGSDHLFRLANVPEPTVSLTMLAGGLGLCLRRNRSRVHSACL